MFSVGNGYRQSGPEQSGVPDNHQRSIVERFRSVISSSQKESSIVSRFRREVKEASDEVPPENSTHPLREKVVSITSDAELHALDSGALKSSEGDKERSPSRATTASSPSDISECARSVVSNAIGMSLSRYIGSPVTVGFDRSSPTMEITSIRAHPSYTPEEKLERELLYIEQAVRELEEPIALHTLSIYKEKVASIPSRAEILGAPKCRKIVSKCRNLHGWLCTLEQQIHLKNMEQLIETRKGTLSLSEIKQVQHDCRAIYRSAKQCIFRGEIEDRAHTLYMQLLDMETLALPRKSDLTRNSSDDQRLQVNMRKNMESYRKLFSDTAASEKEQSLTLQAICTRIISVSNVKLSMPDSMNELFEKETNVHFQDGEPLTKEEKTRLLEITATLTGLGNYESGVKQFLEFKASKLRILAKLEQIRSGEVSNLSDVRDHLSKCYASLKYMEQNKDIIGHISQQELKELFEQCDQVARELGL